MTLPSPSPRPAHCPTCVCGAKRPLLVEAVLRQHAADYIASLGPTGGNIDGDPGGMDAERISAFVDYLPEAAHAAGFAVKATLDTDTGRLITTVYRREKTT